MKSVFKRLARDLEEFFEEYVEKWNGVLEMTMTVFVDTSPTAINER